MKILKSIQIQKNLVFSGRRIRVALTHGISPAANQNSKLGKKVLFVSKMLRIGAKPLDFFLLVQSRMIAKRTRDRNRIQAFNIFHRKLYPRDCLYNLQRFKATSTFHSQIMLSNNLKIVKFDSVIRKEFAWLARLKTWKILIALLLLLNISILCKSFVSTMKDEGTESEV